jgi:hypothetical protein
LSSSPCGPRNTRHNPCVDHKQARGPNTLQRKLWLGLVTDGSSSSSRLIYKHQSLSVYQPFFHTVLAMDKDGISAPPSADYDVDRVDKTRKRTLGNVRLRHPDTNEIILIPAPSSDPNDPLNWPQWYKYWMAAVICFAMLMCNFLAAGPSIAMVQMAMDFFPGAHPGKNPELFNAAVAKVAYFFTATALLQGLGNFFWVPIANKYGRRPTYVLSYAMYFATAVWLCFEKSYGGFLAGRILMGFAAGAAETVAPITIADIFFLHERGSIMAFYSSFLAIGVALGLIISG